MTRTPARWAVALLLLATVPARAHRSRAPEALISDGGQCVSLARMAASLHAQLDRRAVGYAFSIGNGALVSGSGGWARTSADGRSLAFTPQTRITVASVSKWISAIATMAILQQRGVSLDAPIGPFLPRDWDVPPYLRGLTFAQVLTHTSGIKDFGSGPRVRSRHDRPRRPRHDTQRLNHPENPVRELETAVAKLQADYVSAVHARDASALMRLYDADRSRSGSRT